MFTVFEGRVVANVSPEIPPGSRIRLFLPPRRGKRRTDTDARRHALPPDVGLRRTSQGGPEGWSGTPSAHVAVQPAGAAVIAGIGQ